MCILSNGDACDRTSVYTYKLLTAVTLIGPCQHSLKINFLLPGLFTSITVGLLNNWGSSFTKAMRSPLSLGSGFSRECFSCFMAPARILGTLDSPPLDLASAIAGNSSPGRTGDMSNHDTHDAAWCTEMHGSKWEQSACILLSSSSTDITRKCNKTCTCMHANQTFNCRKCRYKRGFSPTSTLTF